jgi:DNA primase
MYKPFEDRMYRFRGHNLKDVLFGYNSLISGGDLIITSSMKDVVMFYNIGMKAIAPTSEGVFSGIRKKYGELRLRFDRIFVSFDNDKKGKEATMQLCKELGDVIPIFLSGPEKDGADIVKKYGLDVFRTEIGKLIKQRL